MKLGNLFKKKLKPESLLEAKNLGLISQEEFFRLELGRAEKNLKDYTDRQGGGIKKAKK